LAPVVDVLEVGSIGQVLCGALEHGVHDQHDGQTETDGELGSSLVKK